MLEVIIAMLYLTLLFVPLLASLSQGIDQANEAKFITTSTLLAQEHISEIKSEESSSSNKLGVGIKEGDFGSDYPDYTYTQSVESTPLAGYYKYTLKIKLGSGRGGFVNTFETFLSF